LAAIASPLTEVPPPGTNYEAIASPLTEVPPPGTN